MYDFLIVGAGIAGASLAYQLAPHSRVALLERETQPGYHSTGRSAGLFLETYGTPMIRKLTCASRAFFLTPPEGFAEHPILTPRGVMHVAKLGQEQQLADALALAFKTSPQVQQLTARQVCERVPVLRGERICGGLFEREAMDIDVHALHHGYLRGARENACELLNCAEFFSAAFADGAWTIHLGDKRTLTAATIVNAAGAWADVVAARSGVQPIGLQPTRRTAFTFDAPQGCDVSAWPAVMGVDETYYFKPDAGKLLGSPANADPVVPHDVQAEELDVATGIHNIEDVTTMRIRRPSHTWAGLRSFVGDGDLVVGADSRSPNFFWMAAQGGYGIETAPAASEVAASMLLKNAMPDHLADIGIRHEAISPRRLT